jgi:mono/diheme cytochrome c family protein
LTTVAALAGALSACTPGAYSLDIFREMHYQPSQRLQEPNRLAPPAQSVPISGRAPAIEWNDASSLQNPYPATAQSREQAQRVFQVNCAVCHGKNADGTSAVADRFKTAGAVPPPDFRSQRVRSRADGELYWLISEGIGNMPPFGELLTDEQRWSLIQVIRNPGQ